MTPGGAESDFGLQDWIASFGAETELFNFQCIFSFISSLNTARVKDIPIRNFWEYLPELNESYI